MDKVGWVQNWALIASKVDKLINWLTTIPNVQQNPEALCKLPSFRDVKWIVGYCVEIKKDFEMDKDRCLRNLILGASMKHTDFTPDELSRFMMYLECFMELSNV
jgi:hypothetical protein